MPNETPPPPEMSQFSQALERFGRMAQGFGYGFRGRTPPFVEEDLQRERMAQQERQFGQTLQVQKDQFERQDALTRATIFKMGIDALPKGQEFLYAIPDENKRKAAAKQLAQWASQALQFGSRKADPTIGELSTPEFLEDLFLGGPESLTLVDDIEFTLPEQRRAVGPLIKAGKIKEARDTLEAISHRQQDQILSGVYERIRALPLVKGGYDPETAFQLTRVSRMERRAIELLPNRFDAVKLDRLYQQAGLIPPSQTAKVAEVTALTPAKAEEAKAVKTAEGETPSGQATIALQQAQTIQAQTPTVTPLQQGAGFAVTPKGPNAVPSVILPPGATQSTENQLREEFLRTSKEFLAVRDAYERVRTSAANVSAAGDIALIFSYMKLLDPGSTVREGEFATAQNTAGIEDRIRNTYNRVMRGERLATNQRKDFMRQAHNMFRAQLRGHTQLEQQYKRIATERGVSPSLVIPDLVGALRQPPADDPLEIR